MSRTIYAYAELTPEERTRTLEHRDDLLEAVVAGREAGWLASEHEYVTAAALRLGVRLWPTLIRQLNAEAYWLARAENPPHRRRSDTGANSSRGG